MGIDITDQNLMLKIHEITEALKRQFGSDGSDLKAQQVICVAEECGEFVGAARRYLGMARRGGLIDDLALELADVIIVALVTAEVFNIDIEYWVDQKIEKIMMRGYKETPDYDPQRDLDHNYMD